MSFGLGKMERRVLKVLEWERREHGGVLRRYFDFTNGKHGYLECDSAVGELVDSIGCKYYNQYCINNRLGKDYRSIYQSVSRAVRSLERKGFVKTNMGVLFWEDGWWYKAITLVDDRTKHIDTVKNKVGVNV